LDEAVADVAQPEPATPTNGTARQRRLRPFRRDAASRVLRHVSFPDLVQTRFAWYSLVRRGEDPGRLSDDYREAAVEFQHEHGSIVTAYWGQSAPSAVALTRRILPRGIWRRRVVWDFHRVTDWITRNDPEVGARLHECEFLAIQMSEVLRGTSRRIGMRLVISTACRLLALVDAANTPPRADAKERERNIDRDRVALEKHLEAAWDYYRAAAQGIARIDYSLGMLVGLVILTGVALGIGLGADLPRIEDREFFGCLIAGTVGAIVSVVSRIAAGHRITFEFDVGRPYIWFLGSLRPVLGALFGLAIYFAVVSGIVDFLEVSPDGTARFYFLLVIAFLAGFSERFARDALLGPTRTSKGDPKVERPESSV
jgi:hypothetical protein